ncbi:hypothetical protein JCM11641_003343 [Rhodosporidiobolus odoratus]
MAGITLAAHPTKATRVASGVAALANCLTAGGVFTFPLWSPLLAHAARLSSSQVNLLASAAILGEYAVAAPFGALADHKGPGSVSLGAAVLFVLGFGVLGWRYGVNVEKRANHEEVWTGEFAVLLLSNFLVGCGAAASYFSGVISSSKSAPARHSGLAIGIPCAVFGLSPLFLSSIASPFTSSGGDLDARRYLLFLAVVLFIVNGAGAVLIKNLPWEEQIEKVAVDALEPANGDAEGYLNEMSATERTSLLPSRSSPSPSPSLEESAHSLRSFVSTASFWLLGGIIFLSTGPAEMYMASLGPFLESLVKPAPSSTTSPSFSSTLPLRKRHIALLSIANTLSRLFVGAASDWLSTPSVARGDKGGPAVLRRSGWRKSVRLWFLGGGCIALVAAYGWGGMGMRTPAGLWVVTLTTGVSYGTVFTISPALVRTRWSIDSFGRNWGLLTWFSAVGAMLFTPLFGFIRDVAASSSSSSSPGNSGNQEDGTCFGPRCYQPILLLSATSALLATGMVGVLGKRWASRT